MIDNYINRHGLIVYDDIIRKYIISRDNDVENNISSLMEGEVSKLTYDIKNLRTDFDNRDDLSGLTLDKNEAAGTIFLTANGVQIGDAISVSFSGGGGGGASSNADMTLKKMTEYGFSAKTVSSGAECLIGFTWSSIEEEQETGSGVLEIVVNEASRLIRDIQQGDNIIDIKNYLTVGSNSVTVYVTDIYGTTKKIAYRISVLNLSMSSNFDPNQIFDSSIDFRYTPSGDIEKTIHIVVDNVDIRTFTTFSSNKELSYTIPAQSHGSHTIEAYFTAEVNGETVRSNTLYYEIICVDKTSTQTIIVSPFNESNTTQYTSLVIPYTVYNPSTLTAEVSFYVNNELINTLTVDRTEQTWTYRADNPGTLTLQIVSGTYIKQFVLSVAESDIDVDAEMENLTLYLSSYGRSNNESDPAVWKYGDIEATFTNFNFVSDGWQKDADGISVLRVAGDARLSIPYKIFASDFRTSGKTIEFEFSTHDVMNYDANIISCFANNKGINFTAQEVVLTSEQSHISTQYKEDEHVRISFVVQKRSENRLVFVYINGIMSGCVQYPDNDDFSQANPVNISIGSNECALDLYCIRVYDTNLTRTQVLNNWIADSQNIDDMLYRYNHNNVYDEYGNIVISKLPNDLPYMIVTCPELPQYKGDKKICSVTYVDPTNAARSFTATNVQIDVQGTSSQYYARKNYKMKYNNGFVVNGAQASKYPIRPGEIPVKTFTMKADVASSEGANNVELVRLYDAACPYKTPGQKEDSRVRQGIDGFPIVMFYNDGENTSFLGK